MSNRAEADPVLTLSPTCSVDLSDRTVTRDGEVVSLSPLEAEALAWLAAREGQVVSREELEREVWGYREGVETHTVAVSLRRLRAKVESDPSSPRHIRTIRGKGWVFRRASADPQPVPTPRDSFFGREDELARLTDWLRGDHRLVTVLGQGGVGKTRLVLQAVRPLHHDHGAVRWFDLSEARTAEDVCAVVAQGLDVPLGADHAPSQLGRALSPLGPALCVLDNVEVCLDAVRPLIDAWLVAAPQARFLCTSRLPLHVKGERQLRLSPLSPSDAAALFLARVPVDVPDHHLEAVHAVVDAVDGLPLAVELAAGRVDVLPVPHLLERLRLSLLEGDSGSSLQASLEVTWRLLSEVARDALATSSVFEGGFDLATAEAVLDAPGHTVDVLQELVRASLLRVDPSGRFTMLALVHEFASTKVGSRDALEARHGLWFGAQDPPADEDLDNVVVACRRALARHDARTASECAVGAWHIYQRQGPLSAGHALIRDTLAHTGHGDLGLRLASMEALALLGRSDEAVASARDTLQLARDRDDIEAEGQICSFLAGQQGLRGEGDEALRQGRRAVEILEETGDDEALARALSNVGNAHQILGQVEEALEAYHAALARCTNAPRKQGHILVNFGVMLQWSGRLKEAGEAFEAAAALLHRVGDTTREAQARQALASLWLRMGRAEDAERAYQSVLEEHRRLGRRGLEGFTLLNLGHVSLTRCRLSEAMQRFQAAHMIMRAAGPPLDEARALAVLGMLYGVFAQPDLGIAALEQALTLEQEAPLLRAWWLVDLACIHTVMGDLHAAAASLDEAGQLLADKNVPLEKGYHCLAVASLRAAGGALDESERLRVEAERLLLSAGEPDLVAEVLLERVGDTLQAGRLDDAEHLLARPELVNIRPDQAATRVALHGVLRVHRGDPDQGRALLDDAEVQLHRLGAELSRIQVQVLRAEALVDPASLEAAREAVARLGVGPASPLAARLARLG